METGVLYRFVKYMALATVVMFAFWMGWEYLQPGHPGDYHVRQGDIRLSDGQYEEALAAFNEALAEAPDHRGALMGRAIVFLQTGRHVDAEAEFNYLIEHLEKTLVPDDATGWGALAAAYTNRAILYDRTGRYEKALADYRRALNIDPELLEGPNVIDKVIYGTPEPATVAQRADYLEAQLALPPDERLLRVPEIDAEQRMYKP